MFGIKTRYLFILLLGGYSFLNIKFTEGDSLLEIPMQQGIFFGLIVLLVLIIWEANRLLFATNFLKGTRKLSYRLVGAFLISVGIVLLLSVATSLAVSYIFFDNQQFYAFNQVLGFNFRINLFLHSINAIVIYNNAFNTAKLESEALKKENSLAQLESLKNQINPHFLFNSFNVLSSIIETDQKLAVKYVDQFSHIYRYLLNNQSSSLVSIAEEKSFIQSYFFLLKTRFQENLLYMLDLPGDKDLIPPATLQLLIENAIKHNEISSKKPLEIHISREGDWIIVRNNKNKKISSTQSSGIGLENIKRRFLLLDRVVPEVWDEEDSFTVKIPVIKFEE